MNSRNNFNLNITDKHDNYLVIDIMIINSEQKFFYNGITFFIPALWCACEKYEELNDKPYIKEVTEKRAYEDKMWILKNTSKIFSSYKLQGTQNYPLRDVDESNSEQWEKMWKERIDLPVATFKLEFEDIKYMEGFEVGMNWDAGAVDILFSGNKI